MKNIINWRIFLLLLVLSTLSVACVFPYVLTIQAEAIKGIGVPVGILVAVQIVQSLVLFSFAIFFGLVLGKKVNFTLPLFTAIVESDKPIVVLKKIMRPSVLSGIAVAVAIYFIDPVFTMGGAGISTHQDLAPAWQKLLAAFYGGITEEILMRLFLMSLFAWVGMKLFRQKRPAAPVIIVSIVLASIIFGLGHLPITASVTRIDGLVVLRAIVLNGIGGVVFGWLFWKKGLESAMIAHFTTDVFLLTILPLIGSVLWI